MSQTGKASVKSTVGKAKLTRKPRAVALAIEEPTETSPTRWISGEAALSATAECPVEQDLEFGCRARPSPLSNLTNDENLRAAVGSTVISVS
jgi:hypothetical protein